MKRIISKLAPILFIAALPIISVSCNDDDNDQGCDDGDRECLITHTWKASSTYQRILTLNEGVLEISEDTVDLNALEQYLTFDSDGSFRQSGKYDPDLSGTWRFTTEGLSMSYTSGQNTPYVTSPIVSTLNETMLELKYLESYNEDLKEYMRTTRTTYKR